MQEQIGEDRADARSLRSSYFGRLPSSALQDARFEPTLNETKNSPVGDPVSQHPHQPAVVNGVERRHDRLPTTKTIRSRPSPHVNGIRLKGADFLSSRA